MRLTPGWRAVAKIVATWTLVLMGAPAAAHQVGLSRGDYLVVPGRLDVEIVFARPEVLNALPALDADHDLAISERELAGSQELLANWITPGVQVVLDGTVLTATCRIARLTESDGLSVELTYVLPSPGSLSVELPLVDELPVGHRHIAHVVDGSRASDVVLLRGHRSFRIAPGRQGGHEAVASLLLLGIEHILTGFDHLAFLLGLVVVAEGTSSLLIVVTAFTVAHSLSLAVATLGYVTLSPRIVEPAIALSIVYVAVENFYVKDSRRRWRITFPFGLVHGLGFAGALANLGLPRAQLGVALLLFNLGVEIGQVAVLLLVFPIVSFARRSAWLAHRGRQLASGAIGFAGLVWLVRRLGI